MLNKLRQDAEREQVYTHILQVQLQAFVQKQAPAADTLDGSEDMQTVSSQCLLPYIACVHDNLTAVHITDFVSEQQTHSTPMVLVLR